jgi:hypothetical protein
MTLEPGANLQCSDQSIASQLLEFPEQSKLL